MSDFTSWWSEETKSQELNGDIPSPASGPSRRALLKAGVAAAAVAPFLMRVDDAIAQGIAPKRGGTLTSLLTPEPPVLMVGVNAQGPTLTVVSKIFQPLFTYSPTLDFVPVLAKSWTISDDKKVYTFRLQENVKFHDGQPMTADDVIFSAMKFWMTLSLRARIVFARIQKAEAPDPYTVVITLKESYAPFMYGFGATGFTIVPKHLYDVADLRNNPNNAKPVGTGPFKLVEWQRGSFIRLRRNEDYWKPNQPYLDEIVYRIVPDSQSRAVALQSGQVQLAGGNDIEPFDLPRFQAQPNLSVTLKGWEYYGPLAWIDINKRVKPLDDVRVRRAMSMAMDRNFILQKLWFNSGKVATGPMCETTKFYDASVKLPPFDIAAANKLLDEAGHKADGSGVRFTIRHMPLPYGEVWTRLSEYFRASMQKIGINVTMDTTDAGGHTARMAKWDYETSINYIYQVGDANIGLEQYFTSENIRNVAFNNVGGYSNPRVDELMVKARYATDPGERQKLLSEFQRIAVDDMPYIFLIQMSFPTYTTKRLNNVITTAMGISGDFDDVFLA
ncbi:ABC transporter substrate-binding protein [Tardiphaga sp. 813_E8_N1_3]|uniref:ABC transporter substrate-binding protein n=1 Tax=Tardiphaga sp. 813_E8_N1_3 TaxID=3240760 RepID=UPI003F2101CE